jgi:methyl-accepting chemotaxis protein
MHDIVDSVGRVTGIISEISAAGQEQTAGIDQINQAISQMDQVTQQNAALVEEAAAASEAMQDQAAHLASVVSIFKIAAGDSRQAAVLPPQTSRKPAARSLTNRPSASVPAVVAGKSVQRVSAAHAGGDWEEF